LKTKIFSQNNSASYRLDGLQETTDGTNNRPAGTIPPVRCYHATLPQDKAFDAALAMALLQNCTEKVVEVTIWSHIITQFPF